MIKKQHYKYLLLLLSGLFLGLGYVQAQPSLQIKLASASDDDFNSTGVGPICEGTAITFRVTKGPGTANLRDNGSNIAFTREDGDEAKIVFWANETGVTIDVVTSGEVFDITYTFNDRTDIGSGGTNQIWVRVYNQDDWRSSFKIPMNILPANTIDQFRFEETLNTEPPTYTDADSPVALEDLVRVYVDGNTSDPLSDPLENGSFSGNGVTDSQFAPSMGTSTITYTYNGLCDDVTRDFTITVNNTNGPDLFFLDGTAIDADPRTTCVGQTLQFILYRGSGTHNLIPENVDIIAYPGSGSPEILTKENVIIIDSDDILQFDVTLDNTAFTMLEARVDDPSGLDFESSNQLGVTVDPLASVTLNRQVAPNNRVPEYSITHPPVLLTDILRVNVDPDGRGRHLTTDETNTEGYFQGSGVITNPDGGSQYFNPSLFDNSTTGDKFITYVHTASCGNPVSNRRKIIVNPSTTSTPTLYVNNNGELVNELPPGATLQVCEDQTTPLQFTVYGEDITDLQILNVFGESENDITDDIITGSPASPVTTIGGGALFEFIGAKFPVGTYEIGVKNDDVSSESLSNTIIVEVTERPAIAIENADASITYSLETLRANLLSDINITGLTSDESPLANGRFAGEGVFESEGQYYIYPILFDDAGETTIQYIYERNGCTVTDDLQVIILDPNALFTPLSRSYCVNGEDVIISFNRAALNLSDLDQILEVQISINGEASITPNINMDDPDAIRDEFTFQPSGYSADSIVDITAYVSIRQPVAATPATPPTTRTIINDYSVSTHINGLPTLTFSIDDGDPTEDRFCISEPAVSLTPLVDGVTPLIPGNGYFEYDNDDDVFITLPNGQHEFLPSNLGVGIHNIRYTYLDENNCTSSSDTITVEIYQLNIDFTGLSDNTPTGYETETICANAGIITLAPTNTDDSGITTPITGDDLANGFFTIDGVRLGNGIVSFNTADYDTEKNLRIVYTYQESTCEGSSLEDRFFRIQPLPTVSFRIGPVASSSEPYSYCVSADSLDTQLTPVVNSIGVTGADLNKGRFVINTDTLAHAQVMFDPQKYGAGRHTIKYIYEDVGCIVDSEEQILRITSPPALSLASLADQYCLDQAGFSLSPSLQTGTFDATKGIIRLIDSANVTNVIELPEQTFVDFHDPDNPISTGTYYVEYIYTPDLVANDATTCPNFARLIEPVQIRPYPAYTFTITSSSGETVNSIRKGDTNATVPEINVCRGEEIEFSPTVPVGNDVSGIFWQWNFGNENVSEDMTTTKAFNNFGSFDVTLTKINASGCQDVQILRVNVTSLPVSAFEYSGSCEDAVSFDASASVTESGVGSITRYIWQFEEGGKIEETDQPQISHKYTLFGKKQVTLTTQTMVGCTNTIIKEVFVFPSFTPTSDSRYVEGFESGTGDWIDHGTNSTWGINSATETGIEEQDGSAWVTNGGTGYANNEHSFIESPCFNLDALSNPIISMRLWTETDENSDGLALLATVNDGRSWKVVGTLGGGLDWYNSQGILGSPGEDESVTGSENNRKLGWSGKTNGWKTARYSLREVKQDLEQDPTSVGYARFRLAFGSNGDNPIGETLRGVAVDEVMIREKNRMLVIEHFTNTSSEEAGAEDQGLTDFMTNPVNTNVIDIRYHTDFPNDDVLNAKNQADPSARALHYGIPKVPRSVLDGIYFENIPFSEKRQEEDDRGWGQLAYTTRTLLDAPFDITIATPQGGKNGDALTIEATLSKNDSYESVIQNNLVVQIAVIEHLVDGQYRNVLRKLLPHAAGTRVTGEWQTVGETRTETITQTWMPTKDAEAGEFGIVVFVQDEVTKEIYQASYLSIDTNLTGTKSIDSNVDNIIETENTYTVAPNPSDKVFHIVFKPGYEPKEDTHWVVYNAIGWEVASGIVKKGSKSITIQLNRTGSYNFYLKNKLNEKSKMIRH